MAAPAFVAPYTGHATTNPTTSNSLTLPTTAANNILILQVINGGANAAPTIGGTFTGTWAAIGTPSGWTSGWGGVWWARCSGDHAGQTVTLAGATDSCSSSVVQVSGCITTGNPYDTNISEETEAAGANISLAAFATTVADTLVCFCWSIDDNITVGSVTKAGSAMTHTNTKASGGGADSLVGYADAEQAGTGTTGAFAGTVSAGTNSGKRLTAFALKPPTAATVTGAAALAGTSAMTSAGTRTVFGSATLAGTSTVTTAGSVIDAYAIAVLADSPTAYWRLGEPSGTNANDEVGSNDGTYVASPTLGVTGALLHGSTNTAATFASTKYVSTPLTNFGAGHSAPAIELWVKTTTTGQQYVFGTIANGPLMQTNADAAGNASSGRTRFALIDAGSTYQCNIWNTELYDGAWHHVVVWYADYLGILVYLDGNGPVARHNASGTLDASYSDFSGGLEIAGLNWVGVGHFAQLVGSIDEFAVYPAGGGLAANDLARIKAHLEASGRFRGAAALAGTGTFTAVGVTTRFGAATLAGTGAFTATGAKSASGAAVLAGTSTLTAAGTTTRFGAAALAGTGAFTAAGSQTASGAAALAGTSTLTSAGTRTRVGAAALAGTSTLTSAGYATMSATATLAGTSTLSSSGTRTRLGAAALAGTGTLTADGTVEAGGVEVFGAAALAGTSTLTAVGAHTALAAATLAGTSTLTAVGAHTALAAAALAGTSTLAGTATRTTFGAATLAGTGAFTAAGDVLGQVTGSATLAGTSTLTAAGIQLSSGAATLAGTGSFTATGDVSGQVTGAATLAGTSTLTVVGTHTAFAQAALAGTGTFTVAGTRIRFGASALAGTGTLEVAGSAIVIGRATLAGTGTLTVTPSPLIISGAASLLGTGSLAIYLVAFDTYPDLGARDYEVATGGVFDEALTGGTPLEGVRSATVLNLRGAALAEPLRSGAVVEVSLGGLVAEPQHNARIDETLTGGYHDEDQSGASTDWITGAQPDEVLTGADPDYWTGAESDEDERSGEPDEVLTGGEIY